MRAVKLMLVLGGLLALAQYGVVYYNSVIFNNFVEQQAQQTRLHQLKSAVLSKAKDYSLSLGEDDIDIATGDGVVRVAVAYTVPLNLLVYRPELKFRANGTGFLRQ